MSNHRPTKAEMVSNFAMGFYIGFGLTIVVAGAIYSALGK